MSVWVSALEVNRDHDSPGLVGGRMSEDGEESKSSGCSEELHFGWKYGGSRRDWVERFLWTEALVLWKEMVGFDENEE